MRGWNTGAASPVAGSGGVRGSALPMICRGVRSCSREMCACTSNLPARQDAWARAGLDVDPEFKAFHEQLKNVRPAPPVPEWEQIVTGELVKTAEVVITGKMDQDAGLKQLDRRASG